MKCEECLPLIEEYVDGELERSASQSLAAHLATCPACAGEVRSLQQELEIYARYRREVEVTPADWNIVRARIEQDKESQLARPRARLREWLGALFGSGRRSRPALALALLLLIFVGVTAALIYRSRNQARELAAGPQQQQDVIHPQVTPEVDPTPVKGEGGNPAVARDEKEKNTGSQQAVGQRPLNSNERRTAVAVDKKSPASPPLKIRRAPSAEEPRFEEAVADRDSSMMANAQRAVPAATGDFDFELARHAEKTELLLRSFRNARSTSLSHALDLSYEREDARKLLYQNISLRRAAEARGDQGAASLLGTLEPILLDIAHLPEKARARDVRPIEQRMQRKEIVAALQVRALVASN